MTIYGYNDKNCYYLDFDDEKYYYVMVFDTAMNESDLLTIKELVFVSD